jgi:hypothetical protein
MQSETGDTLKAAGYNVTVGSFGSPYKVDKHDGFEPVITNDDLPLHLSEQEIVVIDLFPNDPIAQSPEEKHTSPGENDWWASCSQGVIDPRPRSMAVNQEALDRILSHGGVFVIFAYPRHLQKLIWGHLEYGHLVETDKIPFDNWSFLSILNSENFETSWDVGQEIFVVPENFIAQLLSEHTQEGSFVCTLYATYKIQKDWITLNRKTPEMIKSQSQLTLEEFLALRDDDVGFSETVVC